MKKATVFLTILFASQFAVASDAQSHADWVTEASVMLITGPAGTDLYNSLNADFTLDPMSTNQQQYRVKENTFAKCEGVFYRVDRADGDYWQLIGNAKCQIQAPAGATINQ